MASSRRLGGLPSALLVAVLAFARPAGAQIDIVTERYDPARLGANLQETQLDTSNVNVAMFGKLWSYTVSGSVYAQPLYVRDVAIPGQGTHDVLYVVTMNDVVYAFDADSPVDAPLLSFDLTTEVPGSTPASIIDILGFLDNIVGNVGIESTPQIDLATNTMYLVARTRETGGGCGGPPESQTFCQRLHALDITTLQERPGSPVLLGGSVPGNGNGSVDGVLTFDPKIEDQRASLALSNGRVFIAWSSHSDQMPYHGWVMAYDAATLQQTMIWTSTPDGGPFNGGGIWMAGRAPAVDADGSVYYITGNGNWDGVTNFGESFVKFGPTPDTPLLDWFTPSDYGSLNNADLDLGGSGPILIPGTDLILGGGKGGTFYLTHTSDMGHEANPDDIAQPPFGNGNGGQIKGGPIYWNRDGGVGPWMYVWSDNRNSMNAYHFDGTMFDTTPVSQSTVLSRSGSAGGVLTLSANGSLPGSGIVWSSMAFSGSDPNSLVHPGILRAFDADDLGHELWNSEQDSARDSMGNWPKFSPPIVVNGRVYMASFPIDGIADTSVSVYGLLAVPDFSIEATPPNPGVEPGSVAVYTVTTGSLDAFQDPVHLDVDGLPAGASALFAANDFAAPGSTTLTVQTASDTPLGQATLTITGTSGALTHAMDVGLFVTGAAPGAGIIGVDFVGSGTAMAAVESAGVGARPNWNEAAGATGSSLALSDETGTPTGATMTWSSASVWNLGIPDDPGDLRMMRGYLDGGDAPSSVTISGLAPDPAGYYVYVYADGDNGGAVRSGTYSVADDAGGTHSVAITDAEGVDFDGSYVRADDGAGNYAVFFVAGDGFTLTATPGPASDGTPRAPLNGLQIVHGDRLFADGFD